MSRVLTVRLAFGIVIFSFLCSLFIAAIFSALDPSALSGSNLGISSYIALFVAQIILVLPSALFLFKNGFNLSDNFRLNKISKETLLLSLILSWLTKSIYPSILMHMAINGTSMLFIFLGENAENALLWKGHINPLLLILGAYTFWFSLKNMQFAYRK